jgi:hypothetical protein
MEITVKCRSAGRRELISSVANFYASTLKIQNSKYDLTICTVPGLKIKEGMHGCVGMNDRREIFMLLDSRLDMETLFQVMAHEMVHVKQRVKGQLKHYFKRNGDVGFIWCGRKYSTDYYDSPWEIEAFSRERILANKIDQLIVNS